MSVPRLTFLYPHLFTTAKAYEFRTSLRCVRAGRRAEQRAGLSTSAERRQETYAQRYGPANDPMPPPPLPPPPLQAQGSSDGPKSLATAIEKEVQTPSTKRDDKKTDPTPKVTEAAASAKLPQENEQKPDATPTSSPPITDKSARVDASESHPKEQMKPSTNAIQKPLERVLQLESPNEHKHPHLQAPPYVHHFDTFTLVNSLEQGGFTQAQSITLMKAVRSLLALNLDLAREGLVSKSDVENVKPCPFPPLPFLFAPSFPLNIANASPHQETYLFRAACSELRTEILSLRRASSTTQSTQRAHLQHSFDILSQRFAQEALALKDDLRGLFNDRKMDVRMQQQARDSAIQELNYKITVKLGSESKSEAEGLRWFLVRRAVGSIVCGAVVVLATLKYSSSRKHAAEEEEKKKVAAESGANGGGVGGGAGGGAGGGGGGGGERYTVRSREMGTQTEGEAEAALKSMEAGTLG